MTITFKNNNAVVVYTLEKIIDYAGKNQYIFAAQSVWWIASIIGLTEGLVRHIDTLQEHNRVPELFNKAMSAKPRDLRGDSRIDSDSAYIPPDRIHQLQEKTPDCSEHSESGAH